MKQLDINLFEIIAFNKILYIKELSDNTFDFDCEISDYENIWKNYFDIDNDYNTLLKIDNNDKYMQMAISFGKGMKILRQDKEEMFFSFIISQRKSIMAITKCIDALSLNAGKFLGKSKFNNKDLYSFPSANAISEMTKKELDNCMLGYRTKYIMSGASDIVSKRLNLDFISNLSTDELIKKLMQSYGVGIKVASCIALFAYHRLEVFPIDVWINRIINREYNGKFPPDNCQNKDIYSKYAGILQQYMFYYERMNMKK